MQLLMFFYIILTLFISAFMLVDGIVWGGIALLIGSLLGFAGGSGMRGAMYLGTRKSGIIIGVGLLFAGMLLVFYSDVTVRVSEMDLSGDVWVFLGFVLGFLAARPEDAGVRGRDSAKSNEDNKKSGVREMTPESD